MKRFLLVVLGLLAVPCFAANNIKMVTYFPVPYAAYSDLSVDGTCDVGLLGSCSLDAGAALNVAKKGSDSRALNTGSFIVRSGTLNLQSTNSSPILSTAYLTAGNGSATVGSLNFSHDLAVSQINNSTAQSMTAQNKAILTKLQIFGHTFPTCDATDHKISWQRLNMGGTTGIFLVCGEGADLPPACTDEPTKGNSYEAACINDGHYAGNGQSAKLEGYQTYVWNAQNCSYEASGGCKTPEQKIWTFGDSSRTMSYNEYNNALKNATGNFHKGLVGQKCDVIETYYWCDGGCSGKSCFDCHTVSCELFSATNGG